MTVQDQPNSESSSRRIHLTSRRPLLVPCCASSKMSRPSPRYPGHPSIDRRQTQPDNAFHAPIRLHGAPIKTNFAELIVQLGDDRLRHMLVPAIHRNRTEIRDMPDNLADLDPAVWSQLHEVMRPDKPGESQQATSVDKVNSGPGISTEGWAE
ncbi:hypothetical protein [Nocardia sp. NPDC049707]|uniref:hypothetical protein n=1 Tax=Nocardia sp. NPDC049707 TaxID=3154735 RepID=UPI00341937D7